MKDKRLYVRNVVIDLVCSEDQGGRWYAEAWDMNTGKDLDLDLGGLHLYREDAEAEAIAAVEKSLT